MCVGRRGWCREPVHMNLTSEQFPSTVISQRGEVGRIVWAGRCSAMLLPLMFWDYFVPRLSFLQESLLSSGSLQKILSHIHLSFKQRSVSNLSEKIILQPRCPGNFRLQPHFSSFLTSLPIPSLCPCTQCHTHPPFLGAYTIPHLYKPSSESPC